jgi:hypothetical protein
MHPANPIRRLARRTPTPIDGVVEYGAGFLDDLMEIVEGLPDDPLDAWDPGHIRRTLPTSTSAPTAASTSSPTTSPPRARCSG